MKKVFLCSPDKGIERKRAVAMCELEALESTGGIEALEYESFLRDPTDCGAIQTCLQRAATADEVIILLGLRVGSPCLVEHPAKERLKGGLELKTDRPVVWQWLMESKCSEPPVTWVEAEIIRYRIPTGSNKLPFLIFCDPTLERFLPAYKMGARKAADKNEFRAMIDGLLALFPTVKDSNSAGSDGSQQAETLVCSRIVWLAEFYWWLEGLNATQVELTEGAIKEVLRRRFPGLSRAARGGSFWVREKEESEVLKEFLPLLEGKVWAWDNLVNYLAEETLFQRLYNDETLSRYTEIRLSVREQLWETLTKDAQKKKLITEHIHSLPKKHRSKICVRLEKAGTYDNKRSRFSGIRPLTLLGVGRGCETGRLLVSRYWQHEWPKGIEHYTNFVMGEGASKAWVHVLHARLRDYFSNDNLFKPIKNLLT